MSENFINSPVAVVTGASCGFGEKIVRELADKGWHTIGIARREEQLEELANEVNGEYEVCDISDPDQVNNAAGDILSRHRNINLLVNNAGMAMREHFEDADPDEVVKVMETNYLGTLLVTRALLPGLERAAPSDVINIVSAAGTIVNPHSGPYSASKHAQLALSRSQTIGLRTKGISVHSILPGKANTDGHPQKESRSVISKLTRTDVDTVAKRSISRIGKKPGEIYVPRVLRAVAIMNTTAPVTTGRIVNKLIS